MDSLTNGLKSGRNSFRAVVLVTLALALLAFCAPTALAAGSDSQSIAPPLTLYQERNGSLAFTGSWSLVRTSGYLGGTAKRASVPGASLTVSFRGTSLVWITRTSPFCGKAWVTLDEGAPVLVDLYSPQGRYGQAVYRTGTLADGDHTLRIRCAGLKRSKARGTNIYVDALRVRGTLTTAVSKKTKTTTAPTQAARTTTTTAATTAAPAITTTVAPTTTTTVAPATTTTATTVAPATTATTVAPTTATTVAPATTTTIAPMAITVPLSFDLQAALDAALSGATITIPAGTFTGPFSITKPVTLVGQGTSTVLTAPGKIEVVNIFKGQNVTLQNFAVLGDYSMPGQRGVTVDGGCNGVTLRGLTISDCGFAGIYGNGGTATNLTISGCVVTHCGEFGVHLQNDAGGYGSENLLIENSKFLGFADTLEYCAHGVYLKVARNVVLRNVEAGQTSGVGTHSGFELDDVENAVLENCVAHDSVIGIAISRYPGAGCKDVTIINSGGYNNTKADRFEYLQNTNIIWEATCYGTFQSYL
jgi:hypothetical protein